MIFWPTTHHTRFSNIFKESQRFSKIFRDFTNDNWATSNFFSLTALAGTSNVILGLNLLCQTKSDRSQQLRSTNNWTVSLLWLSWIIKLQTLCRSLFLSLEFDKLTRFEICTLQSDIICCSADDDPRPSDFRFKKKQKNRFNILYVILTYEVIRRTG